MSENEESNPISHCKKSKKRCRAKGDYICSFDNCLKSYGTSSHLRRHEEIHMGRPVKGDYICSFDNCLKSYGTSSHLRRHEEIHMGCFKCTVESCQQEFKTRYTLKKHMDNMHLKKNPKKYKCSYCDDEFNKHNWLTRHLYKHTGIHPYLCPIEDCGKRFLVPSKLKRHMKIHKGYTCPKESCDKIFPNWTLLIEHKKVSHPTIHQCQYCEKEFSTSNNLKGHLKTHELDREVFHCPKPDCTKFFKKKCTLDHHLRSFHEQRPFVCTRENCHKVFKSESAMIAHCSQHDKRKKKKKRSAKPSFAAHLAGLVPTMRKTLPVIEHESNEEKTSKDNSSEIEKNIIEIKLESTSAEKDFSGQTNQDVSSLIGEENSNTEEECIMDNGIQTMLNMIEKRNGFNNEVTVR